MSSEIIVVLVLTVLAVGFIFWVRLNDGKSNKARNDEKGESGAQ
jgi:flagellar basal body-associated protein FliL